jgi:hypothetical protein
MPLIWGRLLHRPAYRFGRMMIGPKPRRKKENLVDGRGLGTPFSIYCAPGPSVQCEVTSLIFSRKQLFSRNDKQTQQQQTKTIEAVSTAFLSVQRAALLLLLLHHPLFYNCDYDGVRRARLCRPDTFVPIPLVGVPPFDRLVGHLYSPTVPLFPYLRPT